MQRSNRKFLIWFIIFWAVALASVVGGWAILNDTPAFIPLDRNMKIYSRIVTVSERAAHSIRYLDFESGQKLSISRGSRNDQYQPPDLIDFVHPSDFIEKKAGSDTIVITRSHVTIRNQNVFVFILNKQLDSL